MAGQMAGKQASRILQLPLSWLTAIEMRASLVGTDQNEKRRWFVLPSVAIGAFGFGGTVQALSVFQAPLRNAGWPDSTVSTALSIMQTVSFFVTLCLSSRFHRFNASAFASVASAICLVCLGIAAVGVRFNIIGLWFFGVSIGLAAITVVNMNVIYQQGILANPRRKGIVGSIFGIGSTLGGIVASKVYTIFDESVIPATDKESEHACWLFLLLPAWIAVFFVPIVPFLYTTKPQQEGGETPISLCDVVRMRQCWLLLATLFTTQAPTWGLISFAVPLLEAQLNISLNQAANYFMVVLAGNLAGRIVWGMLADWANNKVCYVAMSASNVALFAAIATVGWKQTDPVPVVAMLFVIMFLGGGAIALKGSMNMETYGVRIGKVAFGLCNCSTNAAFLITALVVAVLQHADLSSQHELRYFSFLCLGFSLLGFVSAFMLWNTPKPE
jgi:MFS family permease